MADHNALGQQGEALAREHLEQKGHRILEVNWRHGKQEVDIISEVDGTIVFTEVKTRENDYLGPPESWVTLRKQAHLIKAADAYLRALVEIREARFDIVGIILNAREQRVHHLEDAFQPRW
ncbi:MAG: YraN family protein [Bacteroidota bacterium]